MHIRQNTLKAIRKWTLLSFFLVLPAISSAGSDNPHNRDLRSIEIRRGNEKIAAFTVEVVSGIEEMQQGLSGRSSMPVHHGMLFILDGPAVHYFWMKGMEFQIDILFFKKSGALIDILPGLKPCVECKSHKAPEEAGYALEVNAGIAGVLGIIKGDRIVFPDN
jgi:uncharacterized protein